MTCGHSIGAIIAGRRPSLIRARPPAEGKRRGTKGNESREAAREREERRERG